MPTYYVINEIIYVTILMIFLIHELNKFTSIESPSHSLNGRCNCILDEADNRGKIEGTGGGFGITALGLQKESKLKLHTRTLSFFLGI